MADKSGADYSRDTYQVVAGKHHHRTEKGERVTLTRGDTFHPTHKQAADGSLAGKARKVKKGAKRASSTVAKDIGIRALDWGHPTALKKALDANLTEEELEAVGASGDTGFVTADVDAALEARESDGGGEGSADTEEEDSEGGD